MSVTARSCEWLENPLRGRPRPRRNHKPTRTRELKNAVLQDSALDRFFPTVSADDSGSPGLTLLGAADVNVSTPQHGVAASGIPSYQPSLPSFTHHLPEKDPNPCGGQGGGGPPDAGGGYKTEEEEEGGWGRHAAGEHILDGRRKKMKKKAGDAGVKTQLEEDEGDSGIITTKGQSVLNLTAFLENRVHMYMTGGVGVSEGSCTEDEALCFTSEDDDAGAVHDDDVSPVESDSSTNDFTEDYDFLAEIVSSTGEDYLNDCYMNKVYSSPAQIVSHKSESYKVDSLVEDDSPDGGHSALTDDHGAMNDPSLATGHLEPFDFSFGTSGLPKVELLTEKPRAKGDSPYDGNSLPGSKGTGSAAAESSDEPTEPVDADLDDLFLLGSAISSGRNVEDFDFTLENYFTEIFGSAHKNHVPQNFGLSLSNTPAEGIEVLGKPLHEEAVTKGKSSDKENLKYRKFSDEIVALGKVLTEEKAESSRPLSEDLRVLVGPATEETLTPGELFMEGTVAFEKISEESPGNSKSPITEDSSLTPIRSLPVETMTPRTPSTAETGTPNAHKPFSDGPVTIAKGKRGYGTPPPKPPRTFLSAKQGAPSGVSNSCHQSPAGDAHVRAQEIPHKSQNEATVKRSFECGTRDEREVAAGTSLQGDDNQALTLGRDRSTVKKKDNIDLGAEGQFEPILSLGPHTAGVGSFSRNEDDVNVLHNQHGDNTVDVNIPCSPEEKNKIYRKACLRKRSEKPSPLNPGVGTITMHPEGTRSKPKEPLLGRSSRALEEDQEACPQHGAALKFYCTKCRTVICQECREMAHHQPEYHQVLNTRDALAMLRTEAVALLRHYTLISSLHGTLADTYHKFIQGARQNQKYEAISICLRLEDGKVLGDIVQEAEAVVSSVSRLTKIWERVKEWERRQYEWGNMVFLAHRCSLLANITTATDKVYLRAGNWVMPTPWIQLSHMLQPYLKEAPNSPKDTPQTTPITRRRSPSPTGMRMCSGAKDQCFPDNARQVLLSNLIPYIIFNPDIRYFIHVTNHRDVDITLIVVPDEDHWKEYLKKRLRFAVMSPGALRQNGFTPSEYSLLMVEKLLMMGGRHYTQLTASHVAMGTSGNPATSTVVKVSFQDVAVATGRLGLAPAVGRIKQGDLIIDQDPNGRSILSVAVRDIGETPALRLGRVVVGLDGFTYLMEAGNMKRNESSGFRNRILSTVRREEAAVYQVTFGMDL